MALSHENTPNPSADDDPLTGDSRLDAFVARLNQLAKILECQPVLTPEITQRLGGQACRSANREADSPENTAIRFKEGGLTFQVRVLRNLAVLHHDYTKKYGEDIPELPEDVRENIGQVALFLAELDVDLSESPDIDYE